MIRGTWLLTVTAVTLALSLLLFGVVPARQRMGYFPAELMTVPAACEAWSDEGGGLQPAMDVYESEWFGGHLLAAGEMPLHTQSQHDPKLRSYRFTFLPKWGHPLIVRVDEQAGGAPILTAKKLSGYGGYQPGAIREQQVRRLTHAEAVHLRKALQFARLETVAPSNCRTGLDGSRWIVEVNDHGRYLYLNRWSPRGGAVRDVGLTFLALPGWQAANRPT